MSRYPHTHTHMHTEGNSQQCIFYFHVQEMKETDAQDEKKAFQVSSQWCHCNFIDRLNEDKYESEVCVHWRIQVFA